MGHGFVLYRKKKGNGFVLCLAPSFSMEGSKFDLSLKVFSASFILFKLWINYIISALDHLVRALGLFGFHSFFRLFCCINAFSREEQLSCFPKLRSCFRHFLDELHSLGGEKLCSSCSPSNYICIYTYTCIRVYIYIYRYIYLYLLCSFCNMYV